MKIRELAVAVAALSLAGAAMAAGNDTRTTTNRVPTARQGQALDQSTAAQQRPSSNGSQSGNAANGATPSAKMTNGASTGGSMANGGSSSAGTTNGGSQGGMANEEHDPQLVRSAQQALKKKGFDVGGVDGQLGPNTENAIKQFQQAQGIQQTGNLDPQTLSALGVSETQLGTQSQRNGSATQGSAYK